uniref:SipL SPOCS domain-containing protein n=1 Tax=Romanomermis culicivorax TaxID=13658 RepID=A0A915K940_ROMCU
MLIKTISKISTIQPMLLNCSKPIFGSILTISMANKIGDHAAEHIPRDVQIIPAVQEINFMKICGKIKVADGAVVTAHGPVVITMESAFGEHMIKCLILDNNGNDQCVIVTNFLAHPDIHAILNFKENCIQIQDIKLPLKVIALVHSQTELFLNAPNDNIPEEIPEEDRPT